MSLWSLILLVVLLRTRSRRLSSCKENYQFSISASHQFQHDPQQESGISSTYTTCNGPTTVSNSSCNPESLMSLWHSRLGHPNTMVLNKILEHLNVHASADTTFQFCDACQYGKLHQISLPSVDLHTTGAFQVIDSDVWGPSPYLSPEGYRYYIFFVDDFTCYTWIFPLRLKSEVVGMFQYFNKMIERQFNAKIKCLRNDWGGEYRKLQPLLHELGINFRHPCPHVQQQQGKVERKHRSIVEIGPALGQGRRGNCPGPPPAQGPEPTLKTRHRKLPQNVLWVQITNME